MNLSKKGLSFIVPTFRRHTSLTKMISSISTFYSSIPYEIIIVNDDPNDKDVCYLFSTRENITIIQNKLNLGPGKSREEGLEKAKFPFVVFADDDDFYISNLLIYCMDALIKNEKLAFSSCRSFFLEDEKSSPDKLNIFGLIDKKKFLKNFMFYPYLKPNSTFTTVFRKEVVLKTLEFNKYVNDSLIYASCLLYGDAFIANGFVGNYVIHKGNISSNVPLSVLENTYLGKKEIARRLPFKGIKNIWLFKQMKITLGYFLLSKKTISPNIISKTIRVFCTKKFFFSNLLCICYCFLFAIKSKIKQKYRRK